MIDVKAVREWLAAHGYWTLPLAVPTLIFTIWLLTRGEQGATIAQVLSVPLGVYGLALVVWQQSAKRHRDQAVAAPDPVGILTKVAVATAILLVGAVLPVGALVFYDRYLDLDVAFGAPFRLDEGHPVTVRPVINRDTWRGELRFTPVLTAAAGQLSDCVQPARLLITPVADGARLRLSAATHRAEAALDVPEDTRTLELQITLEVPTGQDCVLDVALSKGTLRR